MSPSTIAIRPATEADAEAIIAILQGIAMERIYTAISRPWSAARQRRYLASLSAREAVHLAQSEAGAVIGYETLDLWAPTLDSMAHVGQVGTFLRPEWRRQGVGRMLFQATVAFAREHGFRKFLAQIRSSNLAAQRFYERLGFRQCGRLTRQVSIGGQDDDEILMEFFLW